MRLEDLIKATNYFKFTVLFDPGDNIGASNLCNYCPASRYCKRDTDPKGNVVTVKELKVNEPFFRNVPTEKRTNCPVDIEIPR